MNLLDCPIKDLPSKGGRFSRLRHYYKEATVFGTLYTMRMLLQEITKGKYYVISQVRSELLQFLIDEKLTKF